MKLRRRRGTTLVEGMVSLAIFSIGVIGALQFIIVASRQNTSAARLTHAGGIARQVRSAMQSRGRTWLTGTGPLQSASCTSDASVQQLAGPLASMPCVIDLDAFEGAAGVLVPGYPTDDQERFRRVLVWAQDGSATPRVDEVTVVVSFLDLGRRMFATQPLALYYVSANQAGVEL